MSYWRAFICILYFITTFGAFSIGSYETPAPEVQKYPVNDTCLDCICLAISNCDKSWYCKQDACGAYRMTEPYWIDGGNHTVNNEDPSTQKAYRDCANDEKCARQTASDYLTRYATDCDGNHVIDCYDYAGMHKWGPFGGCQNNPIVKSGSYYDVLSKCLCKKNNLNQNANGHF